MTKRFGLAPLVFVLGLILGIGLTATAWAYQTHMNNALGDLTSARAELNAALDDKAGHRVKAIGLVNQAIYQVRAGIRAGAR